MVLCIFADAFSAPMLSPAVPRSTKALWKNPSTPYTARYLLVAARSPVAARGSAVHTESQMLLPTCYG